MKYVNVKKRLAEYNILKKQIRELEADVAQFEREIVRPVRGTVARLGSLCKADRTAMVIAMCNEIVAGIYDYIASLQETQNEIYAGLRQLSPMEQAIILYKYIQCLSWAEICLKFSYEERQLQRIACRGLAKLEKLWYDKCA